jgi:hypothetical protein
VWQAEYMVSRLRHTVLALACVRHHLPSADGRGMDRLPEDVRARLAQAMVRSLDVEELWRAFAVAMEALSLEVALMPAMDERLGPTLVELARWPRPGNR